MPIRLPMGIVAMLLTIMASGARVATAWEPSRLQALMARQDLRDEVCIAMADGHISRAERYAILADAKNILKPEEYEGFKQTLNRLSPPKSTAAKHPTKVAQKKQSPTMAQHQAPPMADPSLAPTIAAEVVVPDWVASTGGVW